MLEVTHVSNVKVGDYCYFVDEQKGVERVRLLKIEVLKTINESWVELMIEWDDGEKGETQYGLERRRLFPTKEEAEVWWKQQKGLA